MTAPQHMTAESLPGALDDLAERVIGDRPWGTEREDNPFRTRAQARKAARIAQFLRSESRLREIPGPELVEVLTVLMDDNWWWQEAARAAGVNADTAPSATTRAMTIGFLETPALSGLEMGAAE